MFSEAEVEVYQLTKTSGYTFGAESEVPAQSGSLVSYTGAGVYILQYTMVQWLMADGKKERRGREKEIISS